MYYSRLLEKSLKQQLETDEIIVLTGMRRVGKTTLLRRIFSAIESDNKVYLDIENPIEQKLFEEADYNNIWANLKQYGISNKQKAYIFIDEVQAKPAIVKAIKYLYDHYKVKFYLTGSSSFYLKNLFPESLAGRKIIFELSPLTFAEFITFKKQKKDFPRKFSQKDRDKNIVQYEKNIKYYDEYMRFGGFPQVALENNFTQKQLILNDIFKSYFELDVKTLAGFRRMSAFRDVLLLLLQRVGSKLDVSKIASEISISRETIYNYLAFLQGTYFIYLIAPYTTNKDREVSGAKKVYVCDNGLVNQFSQVSAGSLLENAVFHNLKKYGDVRYYQRYSAAEIDFILTDATDTKIGFEVKMTGLKAHYNRLKRIGSTIGLSEQYVITRNFTRESGFVLSTDI